MEIYVHRREPSRVELRTVEEATPLSDAVGLADGELVWLEDSDDALEATRPISEVGVTHRGHVHVNRCRRVEIEVNFNADARTRRFPPAATVRRVFEWATGNQGFKLSETDRAQHVLQICDTPTQPDESDHIGSFIADECGVCFDLVPKQRFEG